MIQITEPYELSYPLLSVDKDGVSVVFFSERELTTAVGKRNSIGQPLPGYVGMHLMDAGGRFYEITGATKGRDLGPLYPGINLSRLLSSTRRLEANLTVTHCRDLSFVEAKDFVAGSLSALRRLVEAGQGDFELLRSGVESAQSVEDLISVIRSALAPSRQTNRN